MNRYRIPDEPPETMIDILSEITGETWRLQDDRSEILRSSETGNPLVSAWIVTREDRARAAESYALRGRIGEPLERLAAADRQCAEAFRRFHEILLNGAHIERLVLVSFYTGKAFYHVALDLENRELLCSHGNESTCPFANERQRTPG